MTDSLILKLESALGCSVARHAPLSVGFGLLGLTITLSDGRQAAVKARQGGEGRLPKPENSQLELEGYMLRELRRHTRLPVPEVYYCDSRMLVIEWIKGGGNLDAPAQRHAAELLAESHALPFEHFGYERDTVIGPLHQPNRQADTWVSFFQEQRLLHMARKAADEGKLPRKTLDRLEKLGERLDNFLPEPRHPSLLHGDLWTGNVIVGPGRIAGLIDPAIYCGHLEIELAFTTMFGTFGDAFFDAYEALTPLEPEFHTVRRELYNLYPLLVHVRLFGARYLPPLNATLSKLGF